MADYILVPSLDGVEGQSIPVSGKNVSASLTLSIYDSSGEMAIASNTRLLVSGHKKESVLKLELREV